jgi:hypothetical protein
MNSLLDVYGLWVASLMSQYNPLVAWTRWWIGGPWLPPPAGPESQQRWLGGLPPPRATLLQAGSQRSSGD